MPMTHRLPTDLLTQLLQRLFLSVLMLLAPVLAHAQLYLPTASVQASGPAVLTEAECCEFRTCDAVMAVSR